MPPTGAVALTIAANAREGTLAITGCSVLALLVPAKLDGRFLKLQTSKDGGTTYFNQTVEADGQHVVRHYIPRADEADDAGWVIVVGWPAVYDHIKIVCSAPQRYARTVYVLVDGSEGTTGDLTLQLGDSGTSTAHTQTVGGSATLTDTGKAWTTNEWIGAVVTFDTDHTLTVTGNTATVLTGSAGWNSDPGAPEAAYTLYFPYPIAYIKSVGSGQEQLPGMVTGAVRWDQKEGCYRYKITDFSGPLGMQTMDLESERQGHLLRYPAATMDGSMGHLTGPSKFETAINPATAIATTKVVPCSSVGLSSVIGDQYGDPRIYIGVGNEVWRSCQGSTVFQVSGTANAAVSTDVAGTLTDTRLNGLYAVDQFVGFTVTCNGKTGIVISNTSTPFTLTVVPEEDWLDPAQIATMSTDATAKTLTDPTKSWTVNKWAGGTATCNGQTLVITSNTATVLTGTGGWSADPGDKRDYHITDAPGWSGGDPGDGYAWEMHDSVLTLPSATQISSIVEQGTLTSGTSSTIRSYLYAAGASASTSLSIYYTINGEYWLVGAVAAEQITSIVSGRTETVLRATGTSDSSLYAGVAETTTDSAHPTGARGRKHFLSNYFDDIGGLGIWLISAGRLRHLVAAQYNVLSLMFVAPAPRFPPLVTGCMWQNRPTVTDGLNIWTIMGDKTDWIGLPALIAHPRLAAGFRYSIETLNAAGHLLIAGVKVFDGTNYYVSFMAFDEDSGQWRVLFVDSNPSTSEPSIMGTLLLNTQAPPNPAYKYLLLSYAYSTNSYVYSLHLPRGFVGVSGTDDEFAAISAGGVPEGVWTLPTFNGKDPGRDGTLIEVVLEAELFEASASHKVELYTRADSGSMTERLQIDGVTDGTGRITKKYQPTGGAAFTLYDIELWGFVNTDEYFPYIHSLEIAWRKRGDTRLVWEILLDTQKWMRDNTKTISDLTTRLAYSRDRTILNSAAITNIMSASKFLLPDFQIDKPSDPSTAPIGHTLIRLEEPI